MAALNPLTREVVFKIVFYGPGLGGKTTTLEYIHAATKPEHRGKMVSLATPADRTLYFDYLPIRVPRVRGMSVRLQLFTVPGQVHFGATRKLVLSGADGVVFVADSQAGRAEENRESLEDLVHNLAEHNRRLEELPHTFHWNKRDLSDLLSAEELNRRFNHYDAPAIETVATRGDGVFEGLERITRLVLRTYESELPRSSEMPNLSSEVGLEDAIRVLVEPTRHTAPPPSDEAPVIIAGSAVPGHVAPGAVRVGSPGVPEAAAAGAIAPALVFPNGTTSASVSAVASPDPGGTALTVTPAPAPVFPLPPAAPPLTPAATAAGPAFSLAEVWPEAERENVRQAEALLAAGVAGSAVLACDLLFTRVLASAAALAGTSDAPRDPGLVAALLGLDGGRYLAFRARVRAARHQEPVTMRDAWECFSLALDARLARTRIAPG